MQVAARVTHFSAFIIITMIIIIIAIIIILIQGLDSRDQGKDNLSSARSMIMLLYVHVQHTDHRTLLLLVYTWQFITYRKLALMSVYC